jgi:CRP/FNR family transcriptional regulator, anaerobic regulatory protein
MDKTSYLKHFSFIEELSPQGKAMLASDLRICEVPPRTPLIQQGEEVSGIYLVEAGALRVYYISAEGREGTLYWIEPGDSCILAINCIFSRVNYPAWVESDQMFTRFGIVSAVLFRKLFAEEASVQQFTFQILSRRVFDLMLLVEEATSLGLEQRVAGFLLRKSDERGVVVMSQEIIANHLGTAREVISRIVRSLAAKGVVDSSRGIIKITDRNALSNFAGQEWFR